MGFLFKEAKKLYRITAVILLLLIITIAACGVNPETSPTASIATPYPSEYTPPPSPTTAVNLPTSAISPTPLVWDNIEQILFDPGSTSVRLEKGLEANNTYTYTLYCLLGQKLLINIAASHNEMMFTILNANNQELAKSQGSQPLQITLSADGEYFIQVTTPNENDRLYGYSLELSLTNSDSTPTTMVFTVPPTTIPSTITPIQIEETAVLLPEPIIFEPGETTTTIAGETESHKDNSYSLAGLAGQELIMFASASQPGIIVYVNGQDNTGFAEFRSGAMFSETLPTTQTYFIQISPQIINTIIDYSLTLSLDSPSSPSSFPSSDPTTNTFNITADPFKSSGTLSPNNGTRYSFLAEEGQIIQIDTTPVNSDITVSLHGIDNTLLGWTTSGIQLSSFLPTTQEYFITLMPSTNASDLNYAMTVTVR